jgi:hypothetical protein
MMSVNQGGNWFLSATLLDSSLPTVQGCVLPGSEGRRPWSRDLRFLSFFEMGSCYAAQAGLKFLDSRILPSQPPKQLGLQE